MKNKGMFLEELINRTIMHLNKEANIHIRKKELPIAISTIKGSRVNGFLKAKADVDYYGVVDNKFVAFEAKMTKQKTLPKAAIKDHQYKFLNKIKDMGSASFVVVYFSTLNKYYLVTNFNEKIKPCESHLELKIIYPGILNLYEQIKKIA